MKKTNIILLFSLLFIIISSFYVSGISKDDLIQLNNDIDNFFEEDPDIIMGSGLSPAEKTLFKAILSEYYPKEYVLFNDETTDIEKDIVLLGSKKTNKYHETIEEEPLLSSETKEYGQIIVEYAVYQEKKVMTVYTIREKEHFSLTGISKSPFAAFLPPPLVPVASALSSILLLLFFNFMANTAASLGKTAVSFMASTHWKKHYKEKEAKKHVKFHVVELPLREAMTIALVIIIVSLAKTYAFSPPWWEVFSVVFATTAAVTLFVEFVRIMGAKKKKIHVESVFWPIGAVVTLVSAWLGTMFSMPSYIRIRKDEKSEWGDVGFMVAICTTLSSILVWTINLFFPSPYFQMYATVAATIAFVRLVPIPPLSGVTIFKRSKLKWFMAFLIAFPIYVWVVFLTAYII